MGGATVPGAAEPYGREGLGLAEARQRVLDAIRPLNRSESLKLAEARGRISAETLLARESVPGFRASIMDGYALGQSSQPQPGERWILKGLSAAGQPFDGSLETGEAIRILTGAPLPDGADWVLPQELVTVCGSGIALNQDASDRPWIRGVDEECAQGDILLTPGQRLGPADLGRLAGCGVAELKVWQQPRIGLLISGDELVSPGRVRPNGAIWESNGTLLETMLQSLGQTVHHRRVVPDQPDALRQALGDLAITCDAVVSTGGVSAGDSDWIRQLAAELGEVHSGNCSCGQVAPSPSAAWETAFPCSDCPETLWQPRSPLCNCCGQRSRNWRDKATRNCFLVCRLNWPIRWHVDRADLSWQEPDSRPKTMEPFWQG